MGCTPSAPSSTTLSCSVIVTRRLLGNPVTGQIAISKLEGEFGQPK
jgi:hypothetical protein